VLTIILDPREEIVQIDEQNFKPQDGLEFPTNGWLVLVWVGLNCCRFHPDPHEEDRVRLLDSGRIIQLSHLRSLDRVE
jgi:hypothetical protein